MWLRPALLLQSFLGRWKAKLYHGMLMHKKTRPLLTLLKAIARPTSGEPSSRRIQALSGRKTGTNSTVQRSRTNKTFASLRALRARQKIRCTFCCWPPGPPLRPLRYVRSEQHSQRELRPAALRAAARRGAAAGGHLRRCRSSTMSPHRLRRGALHLPARRSRQNAHLIF